MLALILRERHHVWRERLIWIQHLGNEVAIYLACVWLSLFSLYVPEASHRESIGWGFLGLIGVTVLLNLVCITTHACMRLRVCCRRRISKKVLPQKAVE